MARKNQEEDYEPIGDVDDGPITDKDVENSYNFESEFIQGTSWFEIHRQDIYNPSSTSFTMRCDNKPEEGWQKFIQTNYADREGKTSKWRIWIKNGINPRTGGKLSKQSPAFAVEPSLEAQRNTASQVQYPASGMVISNNIPPAPPSSDFNKMAAEAVTKILDRAIADKANPTQTFTEMISAVKAINDITGHKEQAPVQQLQSPPDTSMEKALQLFQVMTAAVPKPKDDTGTILELLKENSKLVQTYENKLRDTILDVRENNAPGNPLDNAMEQLDKTLALAERLGYSKGDGTVHKDSTDKWIEAITEGVKVAGPSIAQLAGGLGAFLFSKVTGGNQPQIRPVAAPPPALPAGVPPPANTTPITDAVQQTQTQQQQGSVMELVSLVQAIKVSVSKMDADKDNLEASMERVINAIEDIQGQKEKIDSIEEPTSMLVYLSDIIDNIANDYNINQSLFKISVVMGSMEGQRWKAAFLEFAKGYFFDVEEPTKEDAAGKDEIEDEPSTVATAN